MANFNAAKINGNQLSAEEWNQTASINNAILSSDQTLSGSNLEQLGIGMAKYASSNFYTDGGAVNAYVLSPVGSFKTPDVYFEGMTIKFRAGFANTGASTVNVAGIGVVDLKKADGFTDLDLNEISNTIDSEFRYDGTAFVQAVSSNSFANITISNKFNTAVNTATISSGAITYTGALMQIDGEGATSDTLTTINGGTEGDCLKIRIANSANNITIEDGTGNIILMNARDIELGSLRDVIELDFIDGSWKQASRTLDADFLTSGATNGVEYLPNGRIRQYGRYTSSAHNPTILLPITFPVAAYNARATGDTSSARIVVVTGLTTSSISVAQFDQNAGTSGISFFWEVTGE